MPNLNPARRPRSVSGGRPNASAFRGTTGFQLCCFARKHTLTVSNISWEQRERIENFSTHGACVDCRVKIASGVRWVDVK